MRLLLVGNYGVGNLGDEALKEYFLKRFPEVEWVVMSAKPKHGEVPRFPSGPRTLLTTPWFTTLKALRRCDGVVFGGGSLFTDTESVRACIVWWAQTVFPRLLRKPIYFAFQGVGPFKRKLGEQLAKDAFGRAAFLSVRDNLSFSRCKAWKLHTEIVQTFDPVLLLLENKKQEESIKNVFVVIPRDNSDSVFFRNFEKHLKTHEFDEVVVLSLKPEDPHEKRACATIQSGAELIPMTIIPVHTLAELTEQLSRATFVFSQRYHGALFALAMGKEVEICPLEEGDKLVSLRDQDLSHIRELAEKGETALKTALHALEEGKK